MYKLLILITALLLTLSTPIYAKNVLKDAVRLNRDINKAEKQYNKQVKKTKQKLDKAQANINSVKEGHYAEKRLQKIEDNAAKKLNKTKDKLDPRDDISDKLRDDLKKQKRQAIDNWLAD
ncbi:hypothetical protein L1D44_18725 [Shewanella sp. Isolate13]|uniref:hypothetical protein n=1 Tax=Shewanella sp. Isolate13 TaxID=2908531 RepID=UPI001EFD45DB|nr:hypothetical protein [Shewanella sp. Isolate13]MCG9731826.1 hypothetical protein [Shewanella sp. Isolate13]